MTILRGFGECKTMLIELYRIWQELNYGLRIMLENL